MTAEIDPRAREDAQLEDPAAPDEPEDLGGHEAPDRSAWTPAERREAEVLEREAKACDLRRQRLPWAEIASRLGYRSPSAALKAVQRAKARVPTESAKALIEQEVEDLDAMEVGLGEAKYKGDVDAVEASLKLKAARARYLGLHDVTDTDANMRAVVGALAVFGAALKNVDLGDGDDDDHDSRTHASVNDVPEASSERAGL